MARIDTAIAALQDELKRAGDSNAVPVEPAYSLGYIEECLGEIGMNVPYEVAALWQWRARTSGVGFPGFLELYTIETSIRIREIFVLEMIEIDADPVAPPEWLPLLFTDKVLIHWADVTVDANSPVPMERRDTWSEDPPGRYRVDSIARFLEVSYELLRRRYWVPIDPLHLEKGWSWINDEVFESLPENIWEWDF